MNHFITVTHAIGGDLFTGPRRVISQKVIDNQLLAVPGQPVPVRFRGGVGRTQMTLRGGATLWLFPKP